MIGGQSAFDNVQNVQERGESVCGVEGKGGGLVGEEPLLRRRETVKEVIGLEAELEGGGLGNGLGVLENVGSDAEKGKVEWGQKGCWEVKGRGRGYRREMSGFGRIGGSGGKECGVGGWCGHGCK